jgi:hypothetical protein
MSFRLDDPAGRAMLDPRFATDRLMSERNRNRSGEVRVVELNRAGLQKRSTVERVADFIEICGPYDGKPRQQASRCVQCPEPDVWPAAAGQPDSGSWR